MCAASSEYVFPVVREAAEPSVVPLELLPPFRGPDRCQQEQDPPKNEERVSRRPTALPGIRPPVGGVIEDPKKEEHDRDNERSKREKSAAQHQHEDGTDGSPAMTARITKPSGP
jgi:hypothetical protein